MPWREVYLRFNGVIQLQEPFRRLGQITIDLWATKDHNLSTAGWPLPFDQGTKQSVRERLMDKQRQFKERLKQQSKQGHGRRA